MLLGLSALIGVAIAKSWDGFYGNRSDFYLCKIFEKIRNRIPPTTEPPNHLLQRALRKSYLEATLLLSKARLKEIEPRGWKRLSNQLIKLDQLLSKDEKEREELLWLFNVEQVFTEEWNRVDKTKYPLEISHEYELFMQPLGETVKKRVDEMRKKMQTELLEELERVGSAMAKGGLNLSSSIAVPSRIREMVEKGWIPYEPDETPLPLSDNEKIYWFDCFCGYFQKKLTGEVGDIFQNRLLTNLIIGEGIPREYQGKEHRERQFTFEVFKSELQTLGDKIFARFDRVDSKLDLILQAVDISTERKPALTLPNTIPSSKGFIGREDVLRELIDAHQKGTQSFVLWGIGGSGKTATALKFVESIGEKYLAKIFVDMQGLTNPLSARDAMFEAVRQFDPQVSAEIKEAQLTNLFIQSVQNQPTLMILDNALDSQSVESLAQANLCLIATSRQSFSLSGGIRKKIEQMSPEDARDLLFSIADEKRFEGQADNLAKLAGYLPMALKPLASLMLENELIKVKQLIDRYQNKQELLKEQVPNYKSSPYSDNLTIYASFELSYGVLPDEIKGRWRRLSVFTADFDEKAMAFVLGISEDGARKTHEFLYKLSLLEANAETERFRLHDLAREFTSAKLHEYAAPERIENLSFFRRSLASAFLRLVPSAGKMESFETKFRHAKYYFSVLVRASEIYSMEGESNFYNAVALANKEWENIVAGRQWTADHMNENADVATLCCNYGNAFPQVLAMRLTPADFLAWQKDALRVCQKFKDRKHLRVVLNNLGTAYDRLGDYKKGIECYKQALQIAREVRDRQAESVSLNGLGNMYAYLRDFEQAIEYYQQSLQIAVEVEDREGEAQTLINIGKSHMGLERHSYKPKVLEGGNIEEYTLAAEFITSALKIHQEAGNLIGEADSLQSLGDYYFHMENYQAAIKYFDQSLTIAQEIGYLENEANCLNNLGRAYNILDEHRKAMEYLEQGLLIARQIGNQENIGCFLSDIGVSYLGLGDKEKACGLWKESLTLLEAIESPVSDGPRLMIDKYCEEK